MGASGMSEAETMVSVPVLESLRCDVPIGLLRLPAAVAEEIAATAAQGLRKSLDVLAEQRDGRWVLRGVSFTSMPVESVPSKQNARSSRGIDSALAGKQLRQVMLRLEEENKRRR